MRTKLLLYTLILAAVSAVQVQAQERDSPRRNRGPVEVILGDREGRDVEGQDRSRGRSGTVRGDRDRDGDDRGRRTSDEDYRAPSSRTGDYRGRRSDDDDDEYEYDDDDGYYSDGRRGKGKRKGKGPKFCQNGQGHPVHGMAWCYDKGYGGYRDRDYDYRNRRYDSRRYDSRRYEPSWERRRWEDVIFRRPQQRYPERYLDRGGLRDVLGGRVFDRLEQQRRYLGVREPLVGYWTEAPGMRRGRVLMLQAGDIPLAQLLDQNGDGRVDRILLNNRRF